LDEAWKAIKLARSGDMAVLDGAWQRKLLHEIGKTPLRDDFFLTGGTALAALYLHHRYSFDLALFTQNPTAMAQVPPTMRAIASRFGLRITFTRTLGTSLRVEKCASKQFGGLGRLWHNRADEYSTLHTGGVSYLCQGYEV
jgi:hypothetical protein